MLKQRRMVAEQIAAALYEAEAAIDAAIAKTAPSPASCPTLRRDAGLSALIGQDAVERASEAIAALTVARRAIVETHKELDVAKTQIGLGAVSWSATTAAPSPCLSVDEDRRGPDPAPRSAPAWRGHHGQGGFSLRARSISDTLVPAAAHRGARRSCRCLPHWVWTARDHRWSAACRSLEGRTAGAIRRGRAFYGAWVLDPARPRRSRRLRSQGHLRASTPCSVVLLLGLALRSRRYWPHVHGRLRAPGRPHPRGPDCRSADRRLGLSLRSARSGAT